MSRNVNFIDSTTVVPADYLNDNQEIQTGEVWGLRLDLQSAGAQVRASADALVGQYSIRVGQKPRYGSGSISVTGTGAPGSREIYVTSPNADTPKTVGVEVVNTGGTPTAAIYRKVGEGTWSGSAYTDLRVTNAIQANADQYNSFIFRPLVTSATPLTVRGLVNQTADILRVEDSSANALFRVSSTGVVLSSISTTSPVQLVAGTAAAPSLTFSDQTTGFYSPGSGNFAMAAGGQTIWQTSVGGLTLPLSSISSPLTFGFDVSLYRSQANRLDLAAGDSFNVVAGTGALLLAGVPISSTHLSDANQIMRTTGGIFAGSIYGVAGNTTNPSFAISGDGQTGFYSPGLGQLTFQTAGTPALRITSAGQVQFPVTGSTGGIQVGGIQLFSGSGGSYTGTAVLGIFAQYLEVRKSDGASGLIMSRPDGSRVLVTISSSNTWQFTNL